MRKTRQFISRLVTATFILGLFATPLLLTSCDDLEKALAQLDELGKEDEPKKESKSDLPPIGSRIAQGVIQDVMDREEDEARTEDFQPRMDTPYTYENGAVWTFQPSEEGDGVYEASYLDPEKKGKIQTYEMVKYANSAYEVHPKGRYIAVCIIRIKDDGLAIEEARGVNKKLFTIAE